MKQLSKSDHDVDIAKAAELMRYLLKLGIDNRIMNNTRLEFLRQDKDEQGQMSTQAFIQMFRTVTKHNVPEMEEKLITFLEVSFSM